MKVTTDHLDRLRAGIAPLDTGEARDVYRTGDFPRADRVNDLNMRYRWDLLWAAAAADRSIYDVLSEYKDTHIDTALRAVVPSL